jgi:site-specific recombinase XerD
MRPEIIRFQEWLHLRYPKTTTPKHYFNDVKLFFTLIKKAVDQVTSSDIDDYIKNCHNQNHRPTTINRRLASIRSFYAYLSIEQEDAPPDPVNPKRHFQPCGKPLPRDARDEEVAQLFSIIQQPRDQTMFLMMLRCGLRVSEVRNLSLTDLYLHSAIGRLPRMIVHGKGDVQRTAYLSSQTVRSLMVWLTHRPTATSQALFLNKYNQRLTVSGIQDRLARYCRQAGIWITCHQLRHTFGRHLTEAQVPVTSIQKLLGHAQLRSTEVYMHISDPKVQQDYETAMSLILKRSTWAVPL